MKLNDDSNKKVLYGFFSQKHKEQYGSVTWLNTDNKEVEITVALETNSDDNYNWVDKKFIGEVTRNIRGRINRGANINEHLMPTP